MTFNERQVERAENLGFDPGLGKAYGVEEIESFIERTAALDSPTYRKLDLNPFNFNIEVDNVSGSLSPEECDFISQDLRKELSDYLKQLIGRRRRDLNN